MSPLLQATGIVTAVTPNALKVSLLVRDGDTAFGKARMRSAPALSSLPKVSLKKVPMLVLLNTDHS